MRTRLSITIPPLLLLLGLTACGGSDEPAPQEEKSIASVEAGDCLDVGDLDSSTDDAEFATDNVVACDEDHQFEVTAVVDLPKDYLTDETAELEYREELDDAFAQPAGDEKDEIVQWARDTCNDEFAQAAGLDAFEVDGATGGEDFPVFAGSSGVASWIAFAGESWEERPRVICSARYSELTDNFDPRSADKIDVDGGFRIGDYLSSDFPEELRQCGTYDVDSVFSMVDCDEQHYQEYGLIFDVTGFLDDTTLQRLEDTFAANQSQTDEDYAALDELCGGADELLVGDDYDDSTVKIIADLAGGWGDGTIEGQNNVVCLITPVDTTADLPGGSLIGNGDAAVELVPLA